MIAVCEEDLRVQAAMMAAVPDAPPEGAPKRRGRRKRVTTGPWTPSPKQAAVLEAAQRAGVGRTITTMCEEAGVSRAQFYRWLQNDEGFRAAWNAIWQQSIAKHLPGVVAALLAKALEGDVQAARLLADMAGVVKQRVAVSGDDQAPALRIIITDGD